MPEISESPSKDRPVVIRNALLCEDAREEASGAYTIVGTWLSGIFVDEYPKRIRCRLCFNIAIKYDIKEIRLRVVVKTEKDELFNGKMTIAREFHAGQWGTLVTPSMKLSFADNTILTVSAGAADIPINDLDKVLVLPVRRGRPENIVKQIETPIGSKGIEQKENVYEKKLVKKRNTSAKKKEE